MTQWESRGDVFVHPNGWTLKRLHRTGGGWNLTNPLGQVTTFTTDGGLYLAIDMANEYIDTVTSRDSCHGQHWQCETCTWIHSRLDR